MSGSAALLTSFVILPTPQRSCVRRMQPAYLTNRAGLLYRVFGKREHHKIVHAIPQVLGLIS